MIPHHQICDADRVMRPLNKTSNIMNLFLEIRCLISVYEICNIGYKLSDIEVIFINVQMKIFMKKVSNIRV